MRAIPTVYDGEQYRSRLEVRWKIFFDALNIQTVYEPRTFALISGNYIPDLWLPRQQVYVEIKGFEDHQSKSFDDSIRYQELVNQTKTPLLRIKGWPDPTRYKCRLYVPNQHRHIYPGLHWASFAEGYNQQLCLAEGDKFIQLKRLEWPSQPIVQAPVIHSPMILAALEKGRNFKVL